MEEVRPSVQRGRYGFRAHSGKMAANGNGFPPARTVYDDVFGGPPKYTVPSFPPCVDDYAEIFRGPSPAHKTPPVPFLEPASDCDGEVALVSGDSYADIFGGFACDFTLSLEELLGRSQATAEKRGFMGDSAKKALHVVDGEKKSLGKVPTRIFSTHMGNSDGISSSISENISVASESAHLQLHGMPKPLDMSTEVKNHKSIENSQGEMLGSELDAASECTVVVYPDLPSVKTHSTKSNANTSTAPSVTEKVAEIKLANTADSKPMKRTLSNDSKDNFLPKMFGHELKEDDSNARFKPCQLEDGPCVKPHVYPSSNDYGVDKYDPRHAFLSVTEISLQTQPTELPPPSRPPPKLGIKDTDSNKRGAAGKRLGTSTKDFCENGDLLNGRKSSRRHHAIAASGTCSAEETSKQSSPRFLDVEVDVNSAAAASAAAMKEVMEEAKAKLKLAKELRERRKNSLKSNKKSDREGKKNKEREEPDREEQRNKEQEECDSAQEFFECTLEMTPEVSDCEYKECSQEEQKERRPPKEESDYSEKQRCLDLAEECAMKRLGNGSEFVEESDKNKMKEDTNCYQHYGHKEMVAPALDFELQETERNFVLVQKCTEERARKGTRVVTDFHDQKTNRREHQVEEVRLCRVSEKIESAAVEICERKQNENIGESDHSSYGREDGIRKQIMSEHDTGVTAVQTTQMHVENEKIETDKQYLVGNEEDGKVTATGDIHQQGASSDRLETIFQESMKQEKMNQTKQMAAQAPIGLEETWQREEIEDKFASTLDTHEEECSNRLSISQEFTKGDEVHKKNEKASQEEVLWEDKKKELKSVQEESKGNESKEQVTATAEPHEQGGSSDGAGEPHEECGGSNRARAPHEQGGSSNGARERHEECGSSNRARAPHEQGGSSNGARERHEECGSSNRAREPHEECGSSNGARTPHEQGGSSNGAREPHEECGSSNIARAPHEQGGSSNGAREPHEECGSSNRARAPHEQGGSSNGAREPHEECESSNRARKPHEQGGSSHGAARTQQCTEPHEQRGSSHGAATAQESREQNELHENKEKVQQPEEKLMPGDMEREINEKEKVSLTGETHQESESSNDLKTSEESIKQVDMLKNKKDVAQEDVQLQEEKEKQTNVGQDCQGNEQQEELTAGGRNDKRRGRANGLEDVPESRRQEEIEEDKPKAAQEAVFQEENINMKADEAAYKHTQNEKSFQILVDRDDIGAKSKRQTTQATPVQEIKEKKVEAAQHVNKLEEKDKVLKMSHKINEIQGIEQKVRKLNDICEKTEKEKCQLEKEKLKRDREKEMETLMKLEEEKEREREREKDRIAVERASRDKSVADAWDKAEKAAVERATAEAREKAPPESKVVDRTSAEGRFRAERSALDKATAEARERAAERAIVEKVAAEARERMERAVAERFAASLRDKQKKDNEREDGMCMRTNGARSTTTEVQNARDASSNETEKRRKARLDRYRRTTERAAKALAEKKARDILAQREQTERNRLAESLDGDVKRWSNGKEGNLRALLSTLQYILGTESGWHPVPLTEIITSAAVKKAYRKATLCVHPDKVQQRGASVQQKYICEKVFDLLKEAWNKFNSEER